MKEEQEEDFAQMFEETYQAQAKLEPGQSVEAFVVKISAEWIFLDVGKKSEGYLARAEMLDPAGNLTVKEGDKVRAYFLPQKGHDMHFTTRIGAGAAGAAALRDAHKNGIPVQGTVLKEVKGGFEVRIGDGVRAFCPFSQMGLRREENQAAQIGKSFTFKITECGDRNVVVSRKVILEAERQEKAQSLRASLEVGMRVKGTVTSIQKFGAFVDLGGLEALLPVSEISHSRTENVGDKLSVGQAVDAVIKKLDRENGKVSLSLKEALPDPWERAAQTWPVGSYHNGTVTRLAPFGAFVSLGEGVEGLLHISKLGAGKRISHPKEVIKEGQGVEVRIEAVDRASRKISLTLAAVSREEEEIESALKEYREKAASASEGIGTLGELLKGSLDETDEER
ncbi:MAG: 30S ribosomal protein S1 [Elusimicrobiota bacterium]